MNPVPRYSPAMSLSMKVNMYCTYARSPSLVESEPGQTRFQCQRDLLSSSPSTQTYPALARRWVGGDTRACLRHVARRLLQRSPRRGSEDNHRQATTNVERFCPNRQQHQEVWSWTVATGAPGLTLAGHPRISQLQVGHAEPPVSARQGNSVAVYLSYPGRPSLHVGITAARHHLTVPRHRLSAYLRSSGIRCRWSDDVKRCARWRSSASTAAFERSLRSHLFYSLRISMFSALGCVTHCAM